MYGPPIDPIQRTAPAEIFDVPEAYIGCLVLGVLLSAAALWRRPPLTLRAALFIIGQSILLTAPLAFVLEQWIYGSFPTIDKAGSMAFYLDGVHIRMLSSPVASLTDPAARLIGVHTGHLWVTALFDLALSPVGAFNLAALLSPPLAWFSAWLLFNEATNNPRVSLLMAFPFGMGLHVFRDLNWYTIEKAAIFWIPLFLWACFRAWRDGGRWRWLPAVVLAVSTWMNVYIGMMNALMMGVCTIALWMSRDLHRTRFAQATAAACVAISPLALWQWSLMQSGPQIASPEAFLWERAALDSFTLSPLRWNRLELHRSLNVVALFVAFQGLRRSRWVGMVRLSAMAALLFFLLSLGPVFSEGGYENPVYMSARAVIPGFWRVAKPEVFFHMTWVLLLGIASVQAHRAGWTKRATGLWYVAFVTGWLLMVRTHPAYPAMSVPLNSSLAPDWADRAFQP
jgi:hypothetical protein